MQVCDPMLIRSCAFQKSKDLGLDASEQESASLQVDINRKTTSLGQAAKSEGLALDVSEQEAASLQANANKQGDDHFKAKDVPGKY